VARACPVSGSSRSRERLWRVPTSHKVARMHAHAGTRAMPCPAGPCHPTLRLLWHLRRHVAQHMLCMGLRRHARAPQHPDTSAQVRQPLRGQHRCRAGQGLRALGPALRPQRGSGLQVPHACARRASGLAQRRRLCHAARLAAGLACLASRRLARRRRLPCAWCGKLERQVGVKPRCYDCSQVQSSWMHN